MCTELPPMLYVLCRHQAPGDSISATYRKLARVLLQLAASPAVELTTWHTGRETGVSGTHSRVTHAFVYAPPVVKGPSRAVCSFMVAALNALRTLLQVAQVCGKHLPVKLERYC